MDPSVDHRARRKRVACLYDDEYQGCFCSWSNDLILRFGVTIQLKWSEQRSFDRSTIDEGSKAIVPTL